MTIFDLGDVISVLVLVLLVLYFRARDSNNRSINDVRRFLDNVRSNMEQRFQSILDELEDRSVDMEAQRDLNLEFMRRGEQSYQSFLQSVEGLEAARQRLETLFESVNRYEEELARIEEQFSRTDQQTEQVHKLDTHLKEQRRWAAELQNYLMQKLTEHGNMLRSDADQHLEAQKEQLSENLMKFAKRLQLLEQETGQQAESLQKVIRARGEWDKIERVLQSDAERLRQTQKALRDKLQEAMQQNSGLEDQIAARQNQLQNSLEHLAKNYKDIQKELSQYQEHHRQELRERLEHDVLNLQNEQKALLSKETDLLMQQTIDQVHQRLQEFEQWCSAYFEKFSGIESDIKKDRDTLLEHFRADMQAEMEQTCDSYRKQATELFGDWNILSENYHRLQVDLEHIENRSREELSAQFELYENNFADELRRKQNQLSGHLQSWDAKLKQQLEDLAARAERTQHENWERSSELWEREVAGERRELKEQLRSSRQEMQQHSAEAGREIQDVVEKLKSEAKTRQESMAQQNKERDAELRRRLDEHGDELEQWSQEFQQMEKSIQDRGRRLEEQYETLEVRIQTDVQQMANNFETIEKQQQHILSNGKLIERAETLWRDTREQIAKLREQSSVLNTYTEQSQHLEKEFEYIRQLAQGVVEKLKALEASEERAEVLQQNVQDLEQRLEQTRSKWELLYAQHDRVQQMEETFRHIGAVYQERGKEFLALEEQARNLEAYQATGLQHISEMKGIEARIRSAEQLLGPLEQKTKEISSLQAVIEQNTEQTEQVFEQVSLLQELLDASRQHSDEMEKMRGWLVKAEKRIQEMSEGLDSNIRLAEQLTLHGQGVGQGAGESGAVVDLPHEETRGMVFQLAEKGWDNATIAKQLNISVGEVELILEMGSRI